jgi:sugar-specific transcriptional regulator TrmB
MRSIKNYVDEIKDELESAKDYAEKYIEEKARGNNTVAGHYYEMAQDELKHSTFLHEMATRSADELSKVFVPPEEMLERWRKAHTEYVESAAWIRQMLSM